MTTLITKTIAKICLMLDMLFSIDILLVGGNRPGGGFIGGVLCACGIGLIYVAYGIDDMKKIWDPDWNRWFGFGLLFATVTAISPLLRGHNYFRSAFEIKELVFAGLHLGELELVSSMFFDLGVYFVVVGGILFLFSNMGSDRPDTATLAARSRARIYAENESEIISAGKIEDYEGEVEV